MATSPRASRSAYITAIITLTFHTVISDRRKPDKNICEQKYNFNVGHVGAGDSTANKDFFERREEARESGLLPPYVSLVRVCAHVMKCRAQDFEPLAYLQKRIAFVNK